MGALAFCLAAGAPRAGATAITYVCRHDLCRVGAPGRPPAHLTRDGGYSAVVNVRDSGRVEYVGTVRGSGGEWLADRDLRHPRRVLGSLSTDARGQITEIPDGSGDQFLCLRPFGGSRQCATGRIGFVEWWRTRRFYGQVDAPGLTDFQQRICLLSGLVHCARVVARTRTDCELKEFDVSPDGALLVAVEDIGAFCLHDSTTHARLAIWDVRTGRRVRTLTGGHDDHHPSFSPDGREIVFDRDYNTVIGTDQIFGHVAVVGVGGGRVRTVAKGYSPAWTP